MLFIAGLANLLSLAATAAPLPLVQEPLFGLRYDSDEVHFQAASKDLLAKCGLDPSAQMDRRSVYALTSSGGWEYLIIGGLVRESPDAPWDNDSTGEFQRENATRCDLIDPGNDAFPPSGYSGDPASGEPEYPIGMDVYRNLAKDGVKRFITAFGSREAFLHALDAQNAFPDNQPETVLQATLKEMTQ